jgi:hypothetical protein
MNAGKGGDKEMQSFWPEEGIPGPVLLANHDNAPVIDDIDSDSETLKASETHAINVTNSGGTMFTLLMGMYVKYKDDKRPTRYILVFHGVSSWSWYTFELS